MVSTQTSDFRLQTSGSKSEAHGTKFIRSWIRLLFVFLLASWSYSSWAFKAEIQTIIPSQFGDFSHYVFIQEISFQTEEEAVQFLHIALATWAKQQGIIIKEAKIEPIEKSPKEDIVFFRVKIVEHQFMKIKTFNVTFLDKVSEESLAFKIPSPPKLTGRHYHGRDVDNSISDYVKNLKRKGFLFAKAYITQRTFTDEGVELFAEVVHANRYKFVFHGNLDLNDIYLEEALIEKIQPKPSLQRVTEILYEIYKRHGFYDAHIEGKEPYLVPEEQSQVFEFHIQEGRRSHFNRPKLLFKSGRRSSETSGAFGAYIKQDSAHRYYSQKNSERFMETVKEHMKKYGFYRTKINPLSIKVHKDKYWITPSYEVDIGPKAYLRKISLEKSLNLADLPDISIIEPFRNLVGHPLSKKKTQEALDAVKKILLDYGYLDVKQEVDVSMRLDPQAPNTLRVHLTLKHVLGPRYYFEGHSFLNTCDTSESTLLHYMSLPKSNEPLNQSELEESISNLYVTQLFRAIEVENEDYVRGDTVRRKIILRFHCAHRGSHELGGGVFTDKGFQVFSSAAYRNFANLNRVLSLYYSFGLQPPEDFSIFETIIRLELFWPYFLFSPLDARISSELSVDDDLDFDTTEGKFSFQLEKELFEWLRVTIDLYQFSLEFQYNFNADPFREEFFHLGQVGAVIRFDFANHPLSPTRGHQHTLSSHAALPFLGSSKNVSFIRFISSHSVYLSPSPGDELILALSATVGWIQTIGVDDFIPRSRFFYLGGDESVRGFDNKSIGLPSDTNPTDIQNMLSINFRSELRIKIVENLYIFGFWDAGKVWSNGVNLTSLRQGTGGGFRLQTPLGGVNLAIGVPIDGLGPPTNQIRSFDDVKIHLSLSTF